MKPTFNKSKLRRILQVLEALERGLVAGSYPYGGICYQVAQNTHHATYKDWCAWSKCWVEWPRYSGIFKFPVPHQNAKADDAFLACVEGCDFWGEHPYGEARRDLLKFLITRLREEVYNEK